MSVDPDESSRRDWIVVTDGFWDETPRLRHRVPQAWAAGGDRVLWVERSPFPGEWSAHRFRRAVLHHQPEVIDERLWILPSPPALPRLERRGFPGPLLRRLHGSLMARRVNRAVATLEFRDPILVLMQHGARGDLLNRIPHCLSIYYTHDLFGYGSIPEADRSQEDELCRRVDLVWTTSEARAEALAPHARRIECLPHAVDLEWFDKSLALPVASQVGRIPSPRFVYTGALDFRIDWTLLRALATRHPDWQIVLAGPVSHGSRTEVADLPPNIHALGPLRLGMLPALMAWADALLLPYIPGAMTGAIGRPLKFYDYLASGRPVISTPFADFGDAGNALVPRLSTVEEWEVTLSKWLQEPDPNAVQRRRQEAERNSYAVRVQRQKALVSEALRVKSGQA